MTQNGQKTDNTKKKLEKTRNTARTENLDEHSELVLKMFFHQFCSFCGWFLEDMGDFS